MLKTESFHSPTKTACPKQLSNSPVYRSPLLLPCVPNTNIGDMPAAVAKGGTAPGPTATPPPSEVPSSACCPALLPPVLLPPALLRSLRWESMLGAVSTAAAAAAGSSAAAVPSCAAGVAVAAGGCGVPPEEPPALLPACVTGLGVAGVLGAPPTVAARTTRCMLCECEPSERAVCQESTHTWQQQRK